MAKNLWHVKFRDERQPSMDFVSEASLEDIARNYKVVQRHAIIGKTHLIDLSEVLWIEVMPEK